MFDAFYHVGLLLEHHPHPDEPRANPYQVSRGYKGTALRLLCFARDPAANAWTFLRVESAEVDPDTTLDATLFQSPEGNAPPQFPTVDLFTSDFPGTTAIPLAKSKPGKRLIGVLKNKTFPDLEDLAQLIQNSPAVSDALAATLGQQERVLLSLKLDGRLLADSPTTAGARAKRASEPYANYYQHKNKTYLGRNQTCAFTHETADTVMGFASLYNCYAVKTELSVVSGGFDLTQAWKNLPVSTKAMDRLLRGKHFVEQHLRFQLCGYRYFLLPQFLGPPESDAAGEFLRAVAALKKRALGKDGAINSDLEDDILEMLADEQHHAAFSLVFYEKDKAKFNLLVTIEDLFPRYNQALLQQIRAVEANPTYQGYASKKGPYNQKFRLRFLKSIFPENKKEGSFRQGFFETLRAFMMGNPIDYGFLLRHINRHLRFLHFEDKPITATAVQALLWCDMLLKRATKGGPLLSGRRSFLSKEVRMHQRYEAYFERHREFFDGDARKLTFLIGVYCDELLAAQAKRYDANTPFFKRLNGLKLDTKQLKTLWPQMIAKMEQYDSRFPRIRDLEEAVTESFLAATDFDDMERDEVSFLFTLGLKQRLKLHPYQPKKQPQEEGAPA
ncbi:TM1802 family CRISPR-associated protein [Acanthopleuribacter pedis]|uniref:Uncharacterized protein n=1 Tax=Acanthopleuribacter pedis TaxID=442870 RepID=A0A8J7U2E6_9BACT|nr:TM1802 family CRISPR-associated protein [Acanthopleuribacter pedis]MBO1318512.1 hypothetical protein [Acanthopleuribacter pedis]